MDPRTTKDMKNALIEARSLARELGSYTDEMPTGTQAAVSRKARMMQKATAIVERTTIALNLPEHAPEGRLTELGPKGRAALEDLRNDAAEIVKNAQDRMKNTTVAAFSSIASDFDNAAQYSWAVRTLNDLEKCVESGTYWGSSKPFGWREALENVTNDILQWSPPSSSCPWSNANQIAKLQGMRLVRRALDRALMHYQWEVERTREQLAKQIADGTLQITPAIDAAPTAG